MNASGEKLMGFMFGGDRIFLNSWTSACSLSKTGRKRHFAKIESSKNTV